MPIKNLLNNVAHRPFTIPENDWSFYQEWNRTIFLHWEVDTAILQPFIPKDIELDTYNGKAWISLVAFTMENIRPKYLPAFAPISNFDEINIRTYTKNNNKTGVYFLSIEGGKKLSCFISRLVSKLPYRYSKTNRTANSYTSKNDNYNDNLSIQFKVEEKITQKTDLDHWLTERYPLVQNSKKGLNEFEIHHLEWELNTITISNLKVNYSRFKNLINNQPNLVHYSKGVKVIAWNKKQIISYD